MKNNNLPIGVFDSGVGGLTVLSKLNAALPQENFIYFGDTAHVPYGNKSKETIEKYCLNIVRFLNAQKAKLIIIACNTASAIALKTIQENTDIPVLNVIDPCIEVAVNNTKTNHIGVIGTKTTISSQAYVEKIHAINKNIVVYSKECPLFVPIIEESLSNHSIANSAAKLYLKKIPKEVDTLILGCTHYPLIKKTIQNSISSKISILDSSIVVADYVKEYMVKNSLLNSEFLKGENSFYISDDVEKFENSIANIMNVFNCKVKKVDL